MIKVKLGLLLIKGYWLRLIVMNILMAINGYDIIVTHLQLMRIDMNEPLIGSEWRMVVKCYQ